MEIFLYPRPSSLRQRSHKKNFQAGNCSKECQLNRAKPRELKDISYKLSKNPTVKKRENISFLHTKLGSRPDSAHRTNATLRGVTFTREDLPNII